MIVVLHPSEVIVGDRCRNGTGANITKLKDSIATLGQLQPIGIDEDYNLIFGYRRLFVCESLGIQVKAVILKDVADAMRRLKVERDENDCREPLTVSEAVSLGKAIEALEAPKAAERKTKALKAGENYKCSTCGDVFGRPVWHCPVCDHHWHEEDGECKNCRSNTPGPPTNPRGGKLPPRAESSGKTRDKAAEAVGMSGRTYEKAKAVVEAAAEPDAPPEVKEAAAEMDRTGKVDPAFQVVRDKPKPGWTDMIAGIRKKVFEFADANPSIRPIIAQSLRQLSKEVEA